MACPNPIHCQQRFTPNYLQSKQYVWELSRNKRESVAPACWEARNSVQYAITYLEGTLMLGRRALGGGEERMSR